MTITDRELTADERERMNIWHDITHLHRQIGVALTTRLQEVAGRE